MKRYHVLDDIRGITLASMIVFHGVWDLVYIFDVNWGWFYTPIAYLWQQSICWMFIALSGFCWSLGGHKLRRGLTVFAAGCMVSLVTELATPEQRIRFGVLTLLGFCMLLMIPLDRYFQKIHPLSGCVGSFFLFLLMRNINDGYLGFEGINLLRLPKKLYAMGDVATFWGFTDVRFFSADYFSVFPWFFLFVTGYFGYRLIVKNCLLDKMAKMSSWRGPWGFLGRHSLIIYMLHQPIIYLGLWVIMRFA